MTRPRLHVPLAIGTLLLALPLSASGPDCFTIVVGSKASATGAVMLAHNEDDNPPQLLDLLKVPRLRHAAGERIPLEGGGSVPQAPETAAFVWVEMAGQSFADCFLNEYGVAVVSNQCPSRASRIPGNHGAIGYHLRRIMAERARTAREAVEIAARLLDEHGYRDSGRTYTVADPHEAWMLAVTKGRHWVAARIPDDAVAVLANTFTVGEVDLSDPSRFLGSPDLVAYARAHGWYDPERDGPFRFARAYAAPDPLVGLHSLPRWWCGVAFLSGPDPTINSLPFSFRPAHPVALTDLFAVLRSHYEGTQFETPDGFDHGNPHRNAVKRICSDSTEHGIVAELRPDLPPSLGAVLWFAPRRPCTEPFVPVYAGVSSLPEGFAHRSWRRALEDHLHDRPERHSPDAVHAWWTFVERARRIDADYGRLFPMIRTARDLFQGRVLQARDRLEQRVGPLVGHDPEAIVHAVTDFTATWLRRLWAAAREPVPRPVPDRPRPPGPAAHPSAGPSTPAVAGGR